MAKRHVMKPSQKASPVTVEWQDSVDIGKEFAELAELEKKAKDEAKETAEPADELTPAARLAEIKTLNARIDKREEGRDTLRERIDAAGEAFRNAEHAISGLYWRLGKLLEIEKPLHKGKENWMEWYKGIGLGKDKELFRLSVEPVALTIAE